MRFGLFAGRKQHEKAYSKYFSKMYFFHLFLN